MGCKLLRAVVPVPIVKPLRIRYNVLWVYSIANPDIALRCNFSAGEAPRRRPVRHATITGQYVSHLKRDRPLVRLLDDP